MGDQAWYDGMDWGTFESSDSSFELEWVEKRMTRLALEGRGPPVRNRRHWRVALDVPGADFCTQLLERFGGLYLVRNTSRGIFDLTYDHGYLQVRNVGKCEENAKLSNWVVLNFITTSQEFGDQVTEFLESHLVTQKRNQFSVVVAGPHGPQFHSVQHVDSQLVEDNYSPDTLVGVKHVLADLQSAEPCGRLSIFDGPPGTGKTRLIRSMISTATDKVEYVVVPPSTVETLQGPAMLGVLLNASAQHPGKALCLVLEDADDLLAPRSEVGMGGLSALLNLSDGIVGCSLDLRIVATTNAGHLSRSDMRGLDPAVYRPGRLCRRVEVGPLDETRANQRYRQLTGTSDSPYSEPTVLAKVYADARAAGLGEGFREEPPVRAIGFAPYEPSSFDSVKRGEPEERASARLRKQLEDEGVMERSQG